MELEGDTLVIKRIRVTYRFNPGQEANRGTVDRVLGFHMEHCPVARSLRGSIDITTDLEYSE